MTSAVFLCSCAKTEESKPEPVEVTQIETVSTEHETDPGDSLTDIVISDNDIEEDDEQDKYADADAYFYIEPLSEEVINKITGVSYPAADVVSDPVVVYDDLRYLHILYTDFNGETAEGELICNKAIAEDLKDIFRTLYDEKYQIEKVRLIDEYGGDDEASMEDDNTSCFNYRVVEGSSSLSKHAYGRAIDINPFYNPYVTGINTGNIKIAPEGADKYADRSASFDHKIDENDLCVKLFKEHGFTWGGDWNSVKDYQHFQKED